MLGQGLSVSDAGELSTAIGVEDKSFRIWLMAQTDYWPGEDIKDRD